MTANGFYIPDVSYEHALQTADQDLRAMARAKSVEDEIRFTQYRLNSTSDISHRWSALSRMRLLRDVLAGMTAVRTPPAPAPEPKPAIGAERCNRRGGLPCPSMPSRPTGSWSQIPRKALQGASS